MTFISYVNGAKSRVLLGSGASNSLGLDFSGGLGVCGNGLQCIVELGGGKHTLVTTGSVRITVQLDCCYTR